MHISTDCILHTVTDMENITIAKNYEYKLSLEHLMLIIANSESKDDEILTANVL